MTNKEAIEILTAKAECMRRETSGIDIDCNHRNCDECDLCYKQGTTGDQRKALGVAISALQAQDVPDTNVGDMVSRAAAIEWCLEGLNNMPSAQLEIIRCKDCTYGVQDEYGRWYCRSLGCQIGDEDGNGFCSDAERRTDE